MVKCTENIKIQMPWLYPIFLFYATDMLSVHFTKFYEILRFFTKSQDCWKSQYSWDFRKHLGISWKIITCTEKRQKSNTWTWSIQLSYFTQLTCFLCILRFFSKSHDFYEIPRFFGFCKKNFDYVKFREINRKHVSCVK